ncbi:hypothetical protein LRH25_14440 [Ideonella azotifigens]|uniref:Transmembrane protein n=1 Tax=Ideonella azotifigens TaxID=513160 RepID=A0ABN1K0J8_9BURK|nr:hypothetical protein [Ideonella azotifigens]MCD2341539.1 hypothetical protein [Ideonella azotifigens]
MKSFLKGLALLVATCCVVWIAVLWRWQAQHRDVGVGDMLLYLGLLPLVVFGLLLALRWALRSASARQAAASVAATAPAASGAAQAVPAAAPAGPTAWCLLGHWQQTPAGDDAAALLAATQAGAPRPSPDRHLRDDEGLPVLSARVAELDEAGMRDELEQLPAGTSQSIQLPLRLVRALACLAPLLDAACAQLQAWPARFALEDAEQRAREPGRVRVLAAWPADWSEAEAAAAQDWLSQRLSQCGEPVLAPVCWVLQASRASGPELMLAADKLLDALARQHRDDLVLVLACHSDLDDSALQRLQRERRLFHSARQPKGLMPGEGAAVLLLAATAEPSLLQDLAPPPQLGRPQALRRDQSVDLPGRTQADQAQRAAEAALAPAGTPPPVATLVSDSDQHTARATELFAVSLAQLPHLDPGSDMRLLGTLTGHLGAAGALVMLGAAAAQVQESQAPVLALSLTDSHWRLATLLSPPLAASL